MSRIDDFSQLISGIYSAALAPEQWDDAVAAIARAFDAHTASLVFSANGSHTLAHAQMPPAAAQTYTEHYGRLDHVLCAVDAGPLGAVRTGAELMWPYQNCEFQVDWARPNGLHDGLFVRLTSGSPVASLAVANVKRPERFDSPEHVEMAHLLIPHLQQALRIQGRLDDLDHRSDDLAQASESVSHGIVIVERRRSVYTNAAADRMLCSADGLRIENGCIRADAPPADARLQRSIARASELADSDTWGGSFLCPRRSGRRPYVVHVLPVHPNCVAAPVSGRSMVIIVDPEREAAPPAMLLRRLYGLTRSEAQVALLVMGGEGLNPIAERLSVSGDREDPPPACLRKDRHSSAGGTRSAPGHARSGGTGAVTAPTDSAQAVYHRWLSQHYSLDSREDTRCRSRFHCSPDSPRWMRSAPTRCCSGFPKSKSSSSVTGTAKSAATTGCSGSPVTPGSTRCFVRMSSSCPAVSEPECCSTTPNCSIGCAESTRTPGSPPRYAPARCCWLRPGCWTA